MKFSQFILLAWLTVHLFSTFVQAGDLVEDIMKAAIKLKDEILTEDNLQKWDHLLKGFVPDEMLTFEIESYKQERFFEDIKAPTTIRGTFFVSYNSQEKIDFVITDPLKQKVFYKLNQREVVFSVNATEIGEYEFLFSNTHGKDRKQITFAIDVTHTTEDPLSQADLDVDHKNLENISSSMRDYLSEDRFGARKQQSHLESIQKSFHSMMIFSLIEMGLIITITSWQIYYIKKILDNKRIV